MDFGYTYIDILGFRFFEPMVALSNLLLFIVCAFIFRNLRKYSNPYARQMGMFMFTLGLGSVFGAVGHAVHYQFGIAFFKCVLFIMNALSLVSVLFCFNGSRTLYAPERFASRRILYPVLVWLFLMLAWSIFRDNFFLIKAHAAVVLLYFFGIHLDSFIRKGEKGSLIAALGTGISFLTFPVHSLQISLHDWFNYKDICHLIMIVSVVVIYKGVEKNSAELEDGFTEEVVA